MLRFGIFSLVFLFSITVSHGQVTGDSIAKIQVNLGPFEGEAYHIITKINKEYYKEVENQHPFARVHFDQLDISDRDTRKGFPQVNKTSSFGLILRAELEVKEPGTYSFTLSSDDGSKLWIGNTQVIDNDGPHGFKTKANRICLSSGIYPIKVWYYQGWPTRLALQLQCHRLGDHCLEPLSPLVKVVSRAESIQQAAISQVIEYFKEPIPILFDHWKSDILPQYEPIIADIKSHIGKLNNVIIRVEGHTDDTGSKDLNMDLSRDRAEAIMKAIYESIRGTNNRIQSVGYGADRPVASNDTEPGRHRNRRVEIKVIRQNASN